MILHKYENDFKDLINLTSSAIHIPAAAVERDYYIVYALKQLSNSDYAEHCVFKGGTSLSKCYPGSIDRFSEDIDLTYIPNENENNKQISKKLKGIESIMTNGFIVEKINDERNERNKSAYFWLNNKNMKIKLEIGSSVRPDPYFKKPIKSYIQEYLESNGFNAALKEYELVEVVINTLGIERTFIDKIMAVKRHSICGNISEKARHIYDVYKLFQMNEIKAFLSNKEELKRIVGLTKNTDSVYLQKRNIPNDYDPCGKYNFLSWKNEFLCAKEIYEKLHIDLLYTNDKQKFDDAIEVFDAINKILDDIGE